MIVAGEIDRAWANRCLFGAWLPALLTFPAILFLLCMTVYLMEGSKAFSGFGGMAYFYTSLFTSPPIALISLPVNSRRLKKTEQCTKVRDFTIGTIRMVLSSVVSLGLVAGGIAFWHFVTHYNL